MGLSYLVCILEVILSIVLFVKILGIKSPCTLLCMHYKFRQEYIFLFTKPIHLLTGFECISVPQKSPGSQCTQDQECRDENARCIEGICECSPAFYNKNGVCCKYINVDISYLQNSKFATVEFGIWDTFPVNEVAVDLWSNTFAME